MKRLLIISILFLPILVPAQKLTAYKDTVENAYNFWIYTPASYDSNKNETPVIIFLHGKSLCGRNLNQVRQYGCLDAISMGRKINALVIAPQSPGEPWNPKKILNILDWTNEHFATDTNRVYVVGMSLGGYGTIDFVGTYPERIAAAMALCGGGTIKSYCGLNKVPLWIMHGTADNAVGLSQSQKIVDNMIECGDTSLLIFTKLKGMNHSQLARIFYLDETYQWLFSHSRADSVRRVNRDIIINATTMSKAYQNVDRSSSKFEVVDTKTGSVEEFSATYHIVRKGDTLYGIAKKYHTTVAHLCTVNHIKETSILQIGQRINVN